MQLDDSVETENFVSKENKQSFWRSCWPKTKDDYHTRKSVDQAKESLRKISIKDSHDQEGFSTKYLPLTFMPDFIVEELLNDSLHNLPYMISTHAVLLIADVCGFTRITESYCQKGVSGVEELVSLLNGYMSTLAAMLISFGGDILNFAGDAFFVQWLAETEEDTLFTVAKAYKCAIALQTHPSLKEKNSDGTLQVKIGIAEGKLMTSILGSPSEFLLFVVSGHVLPKVQMAEELCTAGQIVVTKEVFNCLEAADVPLFTWNLCKDGFVKITDIVSDDQENLTPNRIELFDRCYEKHFGLAKAFLIPGIRGVKSMAELNYLSELTMVTTVFIVLLNVDIEEPTVLDQAFDITLSSVKNFGGILNKMLLFDKGCTFLIAFGLPFLKHSNDAARGILCAEDVVNKLKEIEIICSVGITTGPSFCGIVGHPQRQEYTVMGSCVNKAARLMTVYSDEPIVVDAGTFLESREELGEVNFTLMAARKMKGIERAGPIYAYREKSERKKCQKQFESANIKEFESSRKEKEKILEYLETMKDENRRSQALSASLFPVVMIEGVKGSGLSYLMMFTVDAAISMGYKVTCCCTIPSHSIEPFYVVARLIQRMLGITFDETASERERLIQSFFPEDEMQLYHLNHFFCIQFEPPKVVTTDKKWREQQFIRLFSTLIIKSSQDQHMMIAVNYIDYMDEYSWLVFENLGKEKNLIFVFSLSVGFQEPSVTASIFRLKSYIHIKVESSEQEYFASLICWFLVVKAVEKELFHYLYEQTEGNTQLLNEMRSSPSWTKCIDYIPFKEIKNLSSFYLPQLHFVKEKCISVMACRFKPGLDLSEMSLPTNINDVIKERFNNLTVQDVLLLKRAAVLGEDFDQYTLQSISSENEQDDVITSINNLLSYNIFSTACLPDRTEEKPLLHQPHLKMGFLSLCFCYEVYDKISQRCDTFITTVGPYHRLKWRTNAFRTYVLKTMTREQLYRMHVEIADELERKTHFCASCKAKMFQAMREKQTVKNIRSRQVPIDSTSCVCLGNKRAVFTNIARVYKETGMKRLPVIYMNKAAEACNNMNYPIQAIYYAHLADKLFPTWSDDECEEEKVFDTLVLKADLNKTIARALLIMGDFYAAATLVEKALAVYEMRTLCLHGIYKPKEFTKILSRYDQVYTEGLTELIGMLSRIYVSAGYSKSALQILKIEFIVLSYYPVSFVQILSHMVSMHQCRHELKQCQKLQKLEDIIIINCRSGQRRLDRFLDLSEVNLIRTSFVTITEVNLIHANLKKAEKIVEDAVQIFTHLNDDTTITFMHLLLFEILYHRKKHSECLKVLNKIQELSCRTENVTHIALYYSALANFIMDDSTAFLKTEDNVEQCNEFAANWNSETSSLPKELNFYVSATTSKWCLYFGKHSSKIADMDVFNSILENISQLQYKPRKNSYWKIGGIFRSFQIILTLYNQKKKDFITVSSIKLLKELKQMKREIKSCFVVYAKTFDTLKSQIKAL